jgi:hypothetical protein
LAAPPGAGWPTESFARITAPLVPGGTCLKRKELAILLLLTVLALAVQGYHPYAEDAETYLPGVEKILDPHLFPFNAEFFEDHARATLFPKLMAASVRITHLPLDWAMLLWQTVSVFLFLLACWRLSAKCSSDPRARWAGVALLAVLLTLPVAGTALYIMDQYMNPRNLVAFATVFAVVRVLERRYLQAALFLIFAAVMHPLMAVFAISYCLLLIAPWKLPGSGEVLASLLPWGTIFQPSSNAYHQVAQSHSYDYLLCWRWFEWLGIFAPIAILGGFAHWARRGQRNALSLLCRALILYELVWFGAALLLSIPRRFETLARFQPMRSLYLLYVFLFLLGGIRLGEHVLKDRLWRWALLFLPLGAGMFLAQRSLFPASAHLEWPGAFPQNRWAQSFLWIRENTPVDAIFALDPSHKNIHGEDTEGFRALAQRSMLADAAEDSGAVTMFPPLGEEWARQVEAQHGWKEFQAQDFRRLHAEYGVNWVVLQQPGVAGLECPYQNQAVQVCRL